MKLDLLGDTIPLSRGIGSWRLKTHAKNPIALNGAPGEAWETYNLASMLPLDLLSGVKREQVRQGDKRSGEGPQRIKA